MSLIPGTPDLLLFVALALIFSLLDWRMLYASLIRADAAGAPGARLRFYAIEIAWQWAFVACVVALWLARSRPWGALGLAPPTGIRLLIVLAVAAAGVALVWTQHRGMRAGNLERVRAQFEGAEPMLPRSASERAGFAVFAVNAGICEEILFRGFVAWYIAAWVGPVPAYALSSLVFGFAHVYLGRDGALRATVNGALFTCIVVLTGSLLPAIVLHAAMDVSAGGIGYRLMTREPAKTNSSSGATMSSAQG